LYLHWEHAKLKQDGVGACQLIRKKEIYILFVSFIDKVILD